MSFDDHGADLSTILVKPVDSSSSEALQVQPPLASNAPFRRAQSTVFYFRSKIDK
ncbi:predicted protein [Plenodomus lingam JN3]|uniref:Predicted protein n=1 Tax=Leptosphaeria maculans (strain JN3 / isolate v23.1.3 / race Av1-4-5-6-7-8) TaxID=985895 RepID=E5ADB1_LEPMJ|nr:predicted protein [Plenodomus lingam JN3]CBY02463.1 predicted protein [Plenodomus lingam JN3]